MWTPVRLNNGSEKGYGLGWTVDDHAGRTVVGHEGGGAIWLAHFPDERLSVVVLCNLNGARADEIQYGIGDLYLAGRAPARRVRSEIKVSRKRVDKTPMLDSRPKSDLRFQLPQK